jgi:hypothetical protein
MDQTSPNFDIYQLDSVQKLELIGTLWDSLGDSAESLPVPEWHREVLEERLADVGSLQSVPLDVAVARLRERSLSHSRI